MLKGINPILTGSLLKALSDMGHGDEIVIGDGNFKATALARANGQEPILVPSADAVDVLGAILEVFPVDDSEGAVRYIVEDASKVPDSDGQFPDAATLPSRAGYFGRADMRLVQLAPLSQQDFYEVAAKAFAIVATNDPRHWFCYILRKGALPDPRAEA